jgi:hypothetical protein
MVSSFLFHRIPLLTPGENPASCFHPALGTAVMEDARY